MLAAGAVGAGVLAADALFIEPGMVEFTEHEIGNRPAVGGRSIRFAQISDLHLSGVGGMHRTIAERLHQLDLDLLFITGDSVDGNGQLAALDEFMRLLDRDLPKYAILGNWEHWGRVDIGALRALYASHNATLLVNASAVATVKGERVLVTGLDDLVGGRPSLERALGGVAAEEHHLVLAHCPGYRDHIARYAEVASIDVSRTTPPVDLDAFSITHLFSGHTHGGQVSLFGFRPFMPDGSGDYIQGWYLDGWPGLYVSRGIGTSILPVRFGARPEVAIFTMWL